MPALAWLALAAAALPAGALAQTGHCGPLSPFEARYRVERNGKPLGQAVASLRRRPDAQWDYQMTTTATKGLGAVVGGKLIERTRFSAVGALLRPHEYHYRQKVAFRERSRDIRFDWQARTALGNDEGDRWQVQLQGSETDRMLSSLQIMVELANGARGQLSFRILDDDGSADEKVFRTGATETIETVDGAVPALRVDRLHEGNKRTTTGWHAPALEYLPVRIERNKQGGDSVVMTLSSHRFLDCED